VRYTVRAILLLSHSGKAVELVVSCSSTLEALSVATVLMQGGIFALLLRNVLLHFTEAIARHFEFFARRSVDTWMVVCQPCLKFWAGVGWPTKLGSSAGAYGGIGHGRTLALLRVAAK
jgi:hypothetical protein